MRRIPTPPVSQAILFRVRLVLLVVVLFAALASCSNGVGESKAAAIPTTTGRPTTTAPPTTVTAPTTTAPTAVAVAATSTADPPAPGPQVLAAGPDYELTSGPSGAGCTPGNTTKLPSGWWAGEVTATHGNSLDLNLVCFYVGEAANEAMERAGLGEEAMGMDTYMVDKNPRAFRVELPSGHTPAICAGSESLIPCETRHILQLYSDPDQPFRLENGELAPTDSWDSDFVVGSFMLWIHVTGSTPDFAYMEWSC